MIRRLLFLFSLVSFAMAASATRIQISEPECQDGDTIVTQLSNGFSVAPTPSDEVFHFCNQTGVNWTSLLMQIHMDPTNALTASQIECGASAFEHCTVSDKGPGLVDAFFYGAPNGSHFGGANSNEPGEFDDDFNCPPSGAFGTGVPNGCEFIVDMSCPDCVPGLQHWPNGTTAYGFANVPEPSSMAMIVAGLGAWVLRRKQSRI